MEKEIFSYYRPPISSATTPTESLSLEEVFSRITANRKLNSDTIKLREILRERGEDAYRTGDPPYRHLWGSI